ncbi:PAF acetylhydrolase family protein [Amylocarpus encephaloides]|uniref:1-alkyl-2-acetylglycerophosphocholine esterase n=1 Tax=Amylocarpus encephaloides TaxID=45428 RepID=A0A9P7YF54_9HELO|nr:PAF acetylhydrolase family protein [Amylocarpus encephaloides]
MRFLKSLLVANTALANSIILKPPGPEVELGTSTAELIDYSRTNTWGNDTSPRSIIISVFYPLGSKPCHGSYQTPYVPSVVSDFERSYFKPYGALANISYSSFKSQFHKKCSKGGADYPVLIFSPGYYRTRLLYSILAQSVAKSGYIVLTIDHPYDADVVVLPSGKVIYGVNDANFTSIEQYQPAIDVRVADFAFLLSTLSRPRSVKRLFPSLPYHLDMEKVGMFGHSAGGASLANFMVSEPRIVGGLNMDGSHFPPVTEVGLDQPFLFFGQKSHNHFTDSSWNATWAKLRGWHAELSLGSATHSTFGDLALLAKVLGLRHEAGEQISRVIGTIDGGTAMVDERTVVVDFFDFVMKGKKSKLLRGDNEGFPDISYVTDICQPEDGCT